MGFWSTFQSIELIHEIEENSKYDNSDENQGWARTDSQENHEKVLGSEDHRTHNQ